MPKKIGETLFELEGDSVFRSTDDGTLSLIDCGDSDSVLSNAFFAVLKLPAGTDEEKLNSLMPGASPAEVKEKMLILMNTVTSRINSFLEILDYGIQRNKKAFEKFSAELVTSQMTGGDSDIDNSLKEKLSAIMAEQEKISATSGAAETLRNLLMNQSALVDSEVNGEYQRRFARKLTAARKSVKLTQKQFSIICGMPIDRYSQYETGRNIPPVLTALRMAHALEIKIDDLF